MEHVEGPRDDGESTLHVFVRVVRPRAAPRVFRVSVSGVDVRAHPMSVRQVLDAFLATAGAAAATAAPPPALLPGSSSCCNLCAAADQPEPSSAAADAADALPPLYIQHRQTRIWYELQNPADVAHNVLLEMRIATPLPLLSAYAPADAAATAVGSPTGHARSWGAGGRGAGADPDEAGAAGAVAGAGSGLGMAALGGAAHIGSARPALEGLEGGSEKYVFVMVGLPARGKTFIARKVARYLNWLGVQCKVFNVGNYRREKLGAHQQPDFFDPHNENGSSARRHMAMLAMDDLFQWLSHGGRVAIFDATNSTVERRALIRLRAFDERVNVTFLESLCADAAVVDANIRETKVTSPDFAGLSPDVAADMFRQRIRFYEEAYETIGHDGEDVSYIKLFDVGRRIEINRLPPGYLPGRIVFFLMTLHTLQRPIWLTRHGQSEANMLDIVGGDSNITVIGDRYAQALATWVMERVGAGTPAGVAAAMAAQRVSGLDLAASASSAADPQRIDLAAFKVWISSLRRTKQTAQYIPKAKRELRMLDEISAGRCDGMTYKEIAQRFPDEYAARNEDKLRFRYPNGESYVDVINRLEPVIFELERSRTPILVVAHNAVIRALYGYFMDKPMEEIPFLDVPLHTVIELTPKAYGCAENRFPLLEH